MVRKLSAIVLFIMLLPATAFAEVPANTGPRALTDADRMFLARQLLAKIKPTLDAAGREERQKKSETDLSNLPEGEELFFRIRLTPQIALEYQLLAVAEKGTLMLSFNDFTNALDFPITFNPDTGIAQGWYIREKKTFEFNTKTRTVVSDKGTFTMSEMVREQDGDVVIPSNELAKWFGLELKPNVSQLEIKLVSDQKLPVQEQIERHDRNLAATELGPPSLPRLDDEQKMLDYPFIDVSSETTHTRPGANGSKPTTTSYANVRTAGDFAHGTLTTQSQFSRDQNLTSMRVNYKKESLDPELLGPLKARRFELGDVTPIQIPITARSSTGVGARVTNRDPFRSVSGAYIDITGYAPPGWDVELYRQDQVLGLQTVGEDGRYLFPKVNLYGSDNTFRVVLYGVQGEVREEEIYIPVDNKRLADAGSAYDVSIVRQDTSTYRKFESKDKDRGAPSVTALYEMPVGNASAITTGLLTRQNGGDQKITGIGALSTTMFDTLWNFNTAVENTGEMAGEIITRKDIGKHQIRNEARVATDKFDYEKPEPNPFGIITNQGSFDREAFGNELSISGPLDLGIGTKPQYNTTLNYSKSVEGLSALTGAAGFSALFRPLSFSQQFVYTKNDAAMDDTLNSLTNVSGAFGRNRVRLASDYQIRPDAQLKTVSASVNRFITQKMDFEGGVRHTLEPRLTEVSGKLNWDTGYGYLSPGISYNTDNDVVATLSSRFGLAREPRTGSPKIFDQPVTSAGGLSAFVYLDKNGDNIFNEGDEPIKDAVIKAPHNGGRQVTDEKGEAFFTNMGQLRLTDVYVDPSSLEDPYWIPGYEGASVLPREGHITTMEFPVHMSGEVDGTVFAKGGGGEGDVYPLKGISVGIYDKTGKKIQGVSSEQDGFYIFSKIPPGSYYLVVDDANITKGAGRPLPQPLTIGYEGTTIYANNIYLKQGTADVPLSVLAGGLPYDADMVKPYEGRNFALNLGQYKSRVAMGLAWFKVRALSGFALSGTDIIEAPANSIPRVGDNGYVLRVSVQDNNLADAYKKCSEIVRKGSYCSVEILSGGLEQQVAARGDL